MDRNYVRYHQYPSAFSGWRLMNNGQTRRPRAPGRLAGWPSTTAARAWRSACATSGRTAPRRSRSDGQDVYVRPFPEVLDGRPRLRVRGRACTRPPNASLYFHTGTGSSQAGHDGTEQPAVRPLQPGPLRRHLRLRVPGAVQLDEPSAAGGVHATGDATPVRPPTMGAVRRVRLGRLSATWWPTTRWAPWRPRGTRSASTTTATSTSPAKAS